MTDVLDGDARMIEAPADSEVRKRRVAFDAREPFFLRRVHDLAIFDERRSGVVIEGRDAEDMGHQGRSVASAGRANFNCNRRSLRATSQRKRISATLRPAKAGGN